MGVPMMRSSVRFLAIALLATVLAGCSDDPPSGEFATDRHAVDVQGTASYEYQAKSRPGGVEDNPVLDELCRNAPDTQGCAEPKTNVSAHFMSLPEPSSEGYRAVLTSSDGSEQDLGSLTAGEGGMYELSAQEFDEDLSGDFDAMEIRMGELLVANASTDEGEQTFGVNPALTGVSATAAYEGKDLTITVTGAEGFGMTALLYQEDEETGALEPSETFPVSGDGEYTYTAQENIDQYEAFHLHVAGSKINVAQGDIA